MCPSDEDILAEGLAELLNPSRAEDHLACAVPIDGGPIAEHPRTALLYVRFREDAPRVKELARFLWEQCIFYALPRRRQLAFQEEARIDMSVMTRATDAAREAFLEFSAKNPSRASEVAEVLAYCVVQHHLEAPQVAAKMALKTSPNMPIHGLDGIHAKFENDALTIYFLEAKLAKTAASGTGDYAKSASAFLSNQKQYLREYSIVSDLGNLDALEGSAREIALDYFDIIGKPNLNRRERYVGIICYSESKHFADKLPVSDGPVDIHEKRFAQLYSNDHDHHRVAARTHLEQHGAVAAKCLVFYVAVPDVNELRKEFYRAMGVTVP